MASILAGSPTQLEHLTFQTSRFARNLENRGIIFPLSRRRTRRSRCQASTPHGADAGLHADQAGRQVGEPRFHLAARPLLPQHDRTVLGRALKQRRSRK